MPRNTGKPLAAMTFWANTELRGRWRALVALGVIAGLAAGLGLAAVAGARRTSTVYERYREATAAPDALVFGTQVGIENLDYAPVLALPEVVDGGTFNLAPVGIDGTDLGTLAPGDDHLYRTVARPLLVHGRLPDPQRPDEVVVNREAAAKYRLQVGDPVTIVSSTDINAFFAETLPSGGPSLGGTVVGIGDSPLEGAFGTGPGFTLSAGFLARFAEVPRLPNLVVRLRPGTDVGEFNGRAAAALGLPDIPVRDLGEDRKRFTHSTGLERTGLLLFAAAALLAGLVLVGQALTRTVYAMAEPATSLRALGLTTGELIGGLVLPLVLTAATGAAVSVATAVALSERFPVGLSRSLEPDLGVHADWLVLAPGALSLALLVLAGAALAAHRATRAPAATGPAAGSAVLRAVRRTAPLPVAIGAGLALEAGKGHRSLPVRPALAGAVAAVVGVIAALGLVQGIDDAVAHPSRAGQVWDATVFPADSQSVPDLLGTLVPDPDVGQITEVDRVPLDVDGSGLPAYALQAARGDLTFVVLRGRAPQAAGEAAIGPATAKTLGKAIGDSVTVEAKGGKTELRIVGTALLPQTAHSAFDQGVWTTRATLDQVGARDPNGSPTAVLVTARPGVEPAALVEHLQERSLKAESAEPPQDVVVLRNIRTLPRALAAFLVVLGLAALGHALVTAVRRRRHDLAVLRALGFRPGQSALCICSQAMTIVVVGLVVGLPLGVVAGRLIWRWVADVTPLLYVAPVAAVAVAVAVPAAVVAVNVLAALPARRAARLRPADVLRTE